MRQSASILALSSSPMDRLVCLLSKGFQYSGLLSLNAAFIFLLVTFLFKTCFHAPSFLSAGFRCPPRKSCKNYAWCARTSDASSWLSAHHGRILLRITKPSLSKHFPWTACLLYTALLLSLNLHSSWAKSHSINDFCLKFCISPSALTISGIGSLKPQ